MPIEVAPMLGEESSLLEDFAILRREEFKLLLQNQKDHTEVDHDGKSLYYSSFFFSCLLFIV